jgi:cytochrome b561
MTVPTPPQVRPRGAGNEADRFGRVSQLFHWTTVALVIVAFGIGLTLDNWPRGNATREAVITVHKSVGLTILLLTLGRIAWLRRSPAPPPADSLALWERRTAWVVHKLLYAILLLYPLSGFVLSQAAGKPVGFWGLFTFPQLVPYDPAVPPGQNPWVIGAAIVHKVVAYGALLGIVALHLAGVVKHAVVDRDPAMLRRMW